MKNKTRYEYLKELAEENGVSLSSVLALAGVLGESEDYDGLVTAIQDHSEEL